MQYSIRLNLMPTGKRKRIEKLMVYLFLKHQILIVLLVLTFSSIALLIGRYTLEHTFINIAQSLSTVTKEAYAINSEVRALNQRTIMVNAVQIGYVPWSVAAVDLAAATPPGIAWNSWDFSLAKPTAGAITLVGVGETREAVLLLADQLKKISWIGSVDVPLDALVNVGAESFTITLVFETRLIY